MKKQILNLGKALNKAEQKLIHGGDKNEGGEGCCNTIMYTDGYNYRVCGLTSSFAQGRVGQQVPSLPTGTIFSHWCCESC